MKGISFNSLGETVTISSDESILSAQPPLVAFIDVPSQEELDVLLERFPTYISMEPPMSYMNKLFSMMDKIPVDVISDPQQNFMARVLHGTSNETIEAIMHLKDYISMQTMEVVRHLLYVTHNTFHLSLFFLLGSWL